MQVHLPALAPDPGSEGDARSGPVDLIFGGTADDGAGSACCGDDVILGDELADDETLRPGRGTP